MARSGFVAFLLLASVVAALSVRVKRTDPASETLDYLIDCASKLTGNCGEDIFFNIFTKQRRITPACCKKLVSIGKQCHESMVGFIILSPSFSKNASITVPRSKKVWNKCVLLAKEAPTLP
ncbi:hypothetical protein EUGRSUZ_C00225 [Eucalyptus grandis]|uniref:Uncharacterized protein n=3 Tax=Eucalyptus TaxID=3932 RepID=A0ACC3L9C4_EUCGR|nr:hypothetical protein EUGRSUZ_C00225 [Eucalyptus grandis]